MVGSAAAIEASAQPAVDDWFDATSAAVWSTCCHLTAGDRRQTEQLFLETYIASPAADGRGSAPADPASLVLSAHRLYLADAPAPQRRGDFRTEVLEALTREQRVALHAIAVIGCAPIAFAPLIGSTEEAVLAEVAAANDALAGLHIDEPIADVFRRTELWLDDEARDRVRETLRLRSGEAVRGASSVGRQRRRREVYIAAAIAVVVVLAAGARWLTAGDPHGSLDALSAVGQTCTPVSVQWEPRPVVRDRTPWTTADGCAVPESVVNSKSIGEACGWKDVRIITLAARVEPSSDPGGTPLTYLYDPHGDVPGERTPWLHYLEPRTDVVDTGLRHDGERVYVSPKSDDAIYVLDDGVMSRWPLLPLAISCG